MQAQGGVSSNHQDASEACRHRRKLLRLFAMQSQGLLAKYVFSTQQCPGGDAVMALRRSGNDNSVYGRIVEDFVDRISQSYTRIALFKHIEALGAKVAIFSKYYLTGGTRDQTTPQYPAPMTASFIQSPLKYTGPASVTTSLALTQRS